MSSLKRALGLFVTFDDQSPTSAPDATEVTDATDVDKLLASLRSPPANSPTKPIPALAPSPAPVILSAAGTASRSFAEVYAAAGIVDGPYAAEKLVRVLDGLLAMPVETRRAAVAAMDAADDTWSIVDPVCDAELKVAALTAEQGRVATLVQEAEAKANADRLAQDQYLADATKELQAQIAELQAQIAAETSAVTAAKAGIDATLASTRQAAADDVSRLSAEAVRLNTISQIFGTPKPPTRS